MCDKQQSNAGTIIIAPVLDASHLSQKSKLAWRGMRLWENRKMIVRVKGVQN